MSESPTKQTVVEVLVQDHREVAQLFEQARAAASGDMRRELAGQIIAELVRHSVAEEQFLYPAVRRHLPNGDERADHEISEHQQAEELMKEIEKLGADDPQLAPKLEQLEQEIKHHVAEEEGEVFPALQEKVGAHELVELADLVKAAKEKAPTRPHPASPNTPPLNKLLAPGAGLVDRLRDKLTHRNV
jgi:hemerythrin superfamily protein